MVMVARLFAPQFLVLYWFAITAMIVHFRGRDRLTLTRQLTDHSTLLAPYNVLMYWFSVLPNRPVLPAASIPELAKLRENWQIIRGEGAGAVRARPASINAAGLRTTTSYKRT
jgi:beta-hydroxylase